MTFVYAPPGRTVLPAHQAARPASHGDNVVHWLDNGGSSMAADAASRWDRLGEFVVGLIEASGVPGVALGILQKGEVHAAGLGVTSVGNPLPVTPGTFFQIGSITKTFSAAASLALCAEDRLLVLDGPMKGDRLDVIRRPAGCAAACASTAARNRPRFQDHWKPQECCVAEMLTWRLAPPGAGHSHQNHGGALVDCHWEERRGDQTCPRS